MDEMHLLLIGVVGGLLAAMVVLGRAQVVVAPERSRDVQAGSGCGGLLLGLLVFGLLVLSLSQVGR